MTSAARTPLSLPPVALALLAGVGLCLALPAPPGVPLAAAFVAIALALVRRGGRWRLLAILVAGFGWAGLHAAHSLSLRLPATPHRVDARLEGRVVSLPRMEPRRIVFELDVDRANAASLEGRTVRLAWYFDRERARPQVGAGERWSIPARLRTPRGLRNPGGSDAEKHAFADRLAATGYVHGGVPARLGPATGLAGWRDAASARIARAVPSADSRFVRALALGDTRALSDADWRLLRANGLTHLIAISGFHVGMVAGAAALLVRLLWWVWPTLARRLPLRIAAAIAGFAAAGVYAAAAGFSLPTVRTLLMIAVVAAAQALRRAVGVVHALALAGIAILVVDPLAVLGAGFWLSFAGVAWLVWCLPRGGDGPIRGLLKAQAVASLGLLPIGVALFGEASLAGPLANLVAVPWWSLVVAPLSVAGLVLDMLDPRLGALAWTLAAECFSGAWPLFEALGRSPLALQWIPESSFVALPLALLGTWWLLMPAGIPGRTLGVVLLLPLLWPDRRLPANGAFELTVADVGQGLAVLVRTNGHALLYDTGPAVPDGFDAGERAVLPLLHARGVRDVDRLVLSHGDLDHAGGLEAVRASMPLSPVFAPEGTRLEGVAPCRAGQRWTWDAVRFEVLHPPAHFPYLANESSCVLRIRGRHGVALLTGDIGAIIERRLVDEDAAALRADLVVVAHHGSRHSSDPAFVAATGARHAAVSAGHANRFRHPHPDVVARWKAAGARVWRTDGQGALTFRFDPDGIAVRARRESHPRMWDPARNPPVDAGLSYRGD